LTARRPRQRLDVRRRIVDRTGHEHAGVVDQDVELLPKRVITALTSPRLRRIRLVAFEAAARTPSAVNSRASASAFSPTPQADRDVGAVRASARAVAAPDPRAPRVTSATLPVND